MRARLPRFTDISETADNHFSIMIVVLNSYGLSRRIRLPAHRIYSVRRAAAVLLLMLACASLVRAQNGPIEDLTGLSLEDLSQLRLSTASRHLDDPRKAPAAVTVIDAAEIERSGWRTLGDLLRSVTGFYTAYDRMYTYAGMRGFLQSGDYNARILLLIDGHRLNDNIYDSALIGTEFPLDLRLVDHVEIVRGGGSSLYGTDAELAVVNVFTKQAGPRVTLEATGETESFAGRGGEMIASGPFAGASGILSASLFHEDGANRLYFPEFDSPLTNNGIAQNIDGTRKVHAFASVRRGAWRIEGMFGKRDKIAPNATYQTLFNDPNNRDIDTRAYVDASWSHEFSPDTQLDVRGYYDAYRYWGSFPYAGDTPGSRTIQINDGMADWLGLEAVIAHRIGKHRVVAGTQNEWNARILQRNYNLGSAPFLDDHRNPTLSAVFGEVELNPNPIFSFNLGARGDWYSEFGTSFSPRAAAMYFPTKATSLKYVFSRAFRAPDPYDEFYVDQMDITATSTHLKPEHIDSHQLWLEQKAGKYAQVAISGFSNHLFREIEETYDPVQNSTHFANLTGDIARGVEIEATAKYASGWAARSSYSYVRAWESEDGKKMVNSPSHLAKFNGTAPLGTKLFFNAELLSTSSQWNYLGTKTSGFFLGNATFSTRPFAGGFQVFASCYNIFDRHYATPTGPESVQPATVQDGRTWRFQLTYRRSLERKWDRK